MAFIRREPIHGVLRFSPAKVSEEDKRENQVGEARDVNGAIEYAQKYAKLANCQSNLKEATVFYGIKAIGWLLEASTFCPGQTEISEFINLDGFFSLFSRLNCIFLFMNESKASLLPALIRNTTIVELDLSHRAYDITSAFFRFANESFSKYLAQTKSLKKLNISERASGEHEHALHQDEVQIVADALKLNTSIEELDLQGQPICDAGLIAILDALSSNPDTKISKLNLINTGLTNTGASYLLNFLRKNRTISSIDLVPEENSGGNAYELVLTTEKTAPVKGKIHVLINNGWTEFSFINHCGNNISACMTDAHKHLGISRDLLESLNNDTLKPLLPNILDHFIRCKYITRITNTISPELISQIKIELRKNNMSAHSAFTKGAMFGLFVKCSLTPELGWKIGGYLTRRDGKNIALATKVAAEVAKAEEAKVNLGKL